MKKVLFTATVDSHILQFHLPFLKLFKEKFKHICEEENIVLPDVTIDEIKVEESEF